MGCTPSSLCVTADMSVSVDNVFGLQSPHCTSLVSIATVSSGVVHSKIDFVKTLAANNAAKEHRGLC